MKFNFQPPQTSAERHALVLRMERLREMRDEGEITRRQFKREYGALATTLWGKDFFSKARANINPVPVRGEHHDETKMLA